MSGALTRADVRIERELHATEARPKRCIRARMLDRMYP